MKTEHITAYALGELPGSDREDFERELATSPDLQRELTATIALGDALAVAPTDGLGDDRRAQLLADCRKNVATFRRHRTIRNVVFAGSLTALAAGLLIAPMLPWTQFTGTPKPDFEGAAGGFVAAAPVVQIPHDEKAAEPPAAPAAILLASADSPKSATEDSLKKELADTRSDKSEGGRFLSVTTPAVAAAPPPTSQPVEFASVVGAVAGQESKIKAFTGGWATGSGSGGEARGARESCARLASSEAPARQDFNTEAYDPVTRNRFLEATTNPLSTFSIDVDTASYANVRRFLQDDQRPAVGAVRIEEMINYFPYSYPAPVGADPFSVNVETAKAPWAPDHQLVRIGLRGRALPDDDRTASNLVFLVDVSGSMQPANKLPLLIKSLRALVNNLHDGDRVAIVTYAGSSGLALESTPGRDKAKILEALDRLEAGGCTNGAGGIKLAYETARENFVKGGSNRVVLCTDGDFNVGVTDQSSLVTLIENERRSNVFLSVLGFGTGNLKDSTMEKLADKGNGNYAYIDSLTEGRKVLVEQMGGTLFTIAKDVKIQVEFNPARVAGYRLIGYENRLLAKEDFNDDKKDAGEIGAGHTVTALYEIVPAGRPLPGQPSVDPLKYGGQDEAKTAKPENRETTAVSDELLTVKLRFKTPEGSKSSLIEKPLKDAPAGNFENASDDFQFAAAVAGFGMKLRDDPEAADIIWDDIKSAARRSLGNDPGSHRAEFLTLVEKASKLPEPR